MADTVILDKTFHFIMRRLVERGVAPHDTEVAAHLGCRTEDGRTIVHTLMASGYPVGWIDPNTDKIASFSPFSTISTQYRITVEGQQKWFGSCGAESLAVCWLFPGKTVRIDCPCLDCHQGITIHMRDGQVLAADPSSIVGHRNAVAIIESNFQER